MRKASLMFAVLLLFPPALALGQEGADSPLGEEDIGAGLPVGVRVRIGFAEKIPGTGFTPVLVDLTAREQDHDAVSVVFQPVDSAAPLLRLGPVSLEAKRTRRVRGIAPAKSWLGAATFQVRVESPDGDLLGQTLVYADSTSDRLLLIIDKRPAAPADFSKLQTLRGARPGGGGLSWMTSIVSRVDDLPVSPLGYSGVGAVLLGDLDLERWGEAQANALAGWLAQGGHLIVSLGQRGALLRQSLLGRCLGEALAPVPFDRPPIPGSEVDLRILLGNFGSLETLETTRPPYAAPLRAADDDTVMFRDDARPRGRPFVVARKHGRGKIFLIAADLWSPPFLHVPHTKRLVERLLFAGARYTPRSALLFHDLAAVRQPAQVGPAFALLIIYALIAGPGIYFVLRAKNRGILLWVAIPLLTLGFTALVPFYRLVLKDAESTLVGVRLIEVKAGSKVAVETVDTLIFSGSLDPKTLSLGGDDAVAYAVTPPQRMRRRKAPRLGAVLGTAGPGGLSFDLPIALWGTRYVSFSRTSEAPKITGLVEASVVATAEKVGARLKIDYEAGRTLRGAVLLYPSRVGPLIHELDTDLKPGDSYQKVIEGFVSAGRYEADEKDLASLMISRLVHKLYKNLVDAQSRAFLIGWSNEPFPVSATPNVRTRASATIVVVSLPVRYRSGVPFGRAKESREASTIADVNTSTLTREIESRFVLPAARNAKVTEVTLRLSARRGSVLRPTNLQVWGIYRGADGGTSRRSISLAETDVKRDDSGRNVVAQLPDAERWVSEDGELIFFQRFDRPRLEDDAGYEATLKVSARWAED